MPQNHTLICIAVALVSLLWAKPLRAAASSDVAILVVSSSHSYEDGLAPLKFATRDGSRFADIMNSVGRVPKEHIVFLTDGATADLPLAIERVGKLVSSCKGGCISKFIFYYSGHADENGLHFKDGRIGKDQLHDALAAVKVPTKIVLLDSCFSGALAQKGVQQAPVFELPKAEYDEPSGSIYISASSAREYSYESDELRGSVFTYHMVTGLSGEADANGDGVVTVDELYQYVYRETRLHSLMFPSASMQTPEFVSRLAGRGAIALSFPAETNAHILLGSDVGGQVTIASLSGIQLFKVDKPFGVKKNLQLPSGRYSVTVSQGYRSGRMQLELRPKRLAMLQGSDLAWTGQAEPMTRKGGEPAAAAVALGVELGRHGGYTGNQGAGAAMGLVGLTAGQAAGPAVLRWLARVGGETHVSHEADDWAGTQLYQGALGGAVEFRNPWTSLSQNLVLSASAGAAYQQQDWHYADRAARSFRTVMPLVSAGAGYGMRWPGLPVTWLIEARRDFLRAEDARTGRRILAANYFGLGLQY